LDERLAFRGIVAAQQRYQQQDKNRCAYDPHNGVGVPGATVIFIDVYIYFGAAFLSQQRNRSQERDKEQYQPCGCSWDHLHKKVFRVMAAIYTKVVPGGFKLTIAEL
jgi:hypothetical protein